MNLGFRPWRATLRAIALGALLAAAFVLGIAEAQERRRGEPNPDSAPGAPEAAVRFAPFDLWVEVPADVELAAWQIEVSDPEGRSVIVGVEGGEHAAFAEPPYYDAALLASGRLVLAAFDTGENLPTGRTRVARLHFQINGARDPDFTARVVVASDSEGREVRASASLANVEEER